MICPERVILERLFNKRVFDIERFIPTKSERFIEYYIALISSYVVLLIQISLFNKLEIMEMLYFIPPNTICDGFFTIFTLIINFKLDEERKDLVIHLCLLFNVCLKSDKKIVTDEIYKKYTDKMLEFFKHLKNLLDDNNTG